MATIAALLEVAPDTATETGMPTSLRPLHLAAKFGHEEAVARLLQAAPEVAGVFQPYSPLYAAAEGGHAHVVRRLLQAAPQAATQPAAAAPCQLPLHVAVAGGHVEVARLLVSAAPAAVEVRDGSGHTPVSLALLSDLPSATREALLPSLLAVYGDGEGGQQGAQQQLEEEMGHCLAAGNLGAARALLACMTCTLPLLELLSDYNVGGTGLERILYAELIERQPLSTEQWDAVPYSLPGLAGALPAVLSRSEAEAGQLVAHLSRASSSGCVPRRCACTAPASGSCLWSSAAASWWRPLRVSCSSATVAVIPQSLWLLCSRGSLRGGSTAALCCTVLLLACSGL